MTRGVPQKMNEKLAFLGDASRHIVIFQKCVFLPPEKSKQGFLKKTSIWREASPKKTSFSLILLGTPRVIAPQPHTPQAPSARPLRPPSPPGPQPLSGSMAPWRCGSVALWLRGSRQFVVCFLKGKQTRETRIPLFIGLGFLSENRKNRKTCKTQCFVDKQSTY